ncbi:MAG: ferredoxin [Pseudomonadota bacterium]
MTFDDITAAAGVVHLSPVGGLHDGNSTIVLLAPKEPGFWAYVTARPEFTMHKSDPLDRWSQWAVTGLAYVLGAEPVFPFTGPPFHPFYTWALEAGVAHASPVGFLVSQEAGLLVSYRGALRFEGRLELPTQPDSPCITCAAQPCLTACPVGALTSAGYDVDTCKAHIDESPSCAAACAVRMACPASQGYPRDPRQTAFHMAAFHTPQPKDA